MYAPTTGEFLSRDPLEYVDGMSLYRAYFVPAMMDPMGWYRVVGVMEPPRRYWIYKREPTDGNIPANVDCFVLVNGQVWPVGCPVAPPDDPDGPTYQGGIDGLIKGGHLLEKACKECRKDCSECTEEQCIRDSWQMVFRLIAAWQRNYGRGCHNPNGHPVGGHFCWDWAYIFKQAVDGLQSKCLDSHVWGAVNPNFPNGPDGIPNTTDDDRTVHYFLWVYVGNASKECSVMFDDGFFDGNTGHDGRNYPEPWIPTPPGQIPPGCPLCPTNPLPW